MTKIEEYADWRKSADGATGIRICPRPITKKGAQMSPATNGDQIAYIGTYTRTEPHVQGKAEGIYTYRLDSATGALQYLSVAAGAVNPSFLAVDSARRYLYAVEELDVYEGVPGGAVSVFAIDQHSSALTLINHQPTHGAHPCYVGFDNSERYALVANYSGGNVSVFPIGTDGALAPASTVVPHEGVPTHHDAPHPHSIVATPDSRYLLAPDCGLDRIFIYRLDTERGTLIANDPPWVMLAPGAGPRHLAFHPSGNSLFCINERNSTLTALAYEPEGAVLRELQTVSTLPDEFTDKNSCADIHIHPSGRFLYGSNRGHNSIAIFAVDAATMQLRSLGHVATAGRTPRNFAIDAAGTFLLVANQDTDTVVTFRIDQDTGALAATGQITSVPSPVCVRFVASPA
jgi:6-phosphogluconolactonase